MSCRVASPSTVRPSAASPAVAASSSQSSRRAIESTRERGRLRERRVTMTDISGSASVKLCRVASEGGVLPK